MRSRIGEASATRCAVTSEFESWVNKKGAVFQRHIKFLKNMTGVS